MDFSNGEIRKSNHRHFCINMHRTHSSYHINRNGIHSYIREQELFVPIGPLGVTRSEANFLIVFRLILRKILCPF